VTDPGLTDQAGSRPAPAAGAARDRRRIIVLIGAVGAGKGTQAAILVERLGLIHLASGNLFRAALAAGTPLGERARGYMERGELVPDEITTAMISEELARVPGDVVLDGFPRTLAQAEALDAALAERGEAVSQALYIEAPTEELVRRVAGRWVCPVCGTPYHEATDPPLVAGRCDREGAALVQRDDDRPEVVRARLAQQVPPMLDVVDYYARAGVLTRVDGTLPIDGVTRQILEAVGAVDGARA
jgi:adenylate kinase